MMVMVMILTIGTAGSALAYRNWHGPEQGNWDCPNDGSGWKFDIASQRKYVVFGSKDSWHLERGDHPYNGLFSGLRSGLRKDLPSADDVTYRIADDKTIATKIMGQ